MTLVDGFEPAGGHEALFDGTDRPCGVYYAGFEADHFAAVRRLIMMK